MTPEARAEMLGKLPKAIYFHEHEEAFMAALAQARSASHCSGQRVEWGLEKWSSPLTPGKFRIFRLPLPANRQGHELRAEVVSPEMPTPGLPPEWMPAPWREP